MKFMARRKSNKIEPSVLTMTFSDTVIGGGSSDAYIDLSQVASIMNRRFYRQGLNWAVAGIKILSSGGSTGYVVVRKLQNTWITSGSWEKTMRHWLKQQNDAVRESGVESTVARFRDYKILMDNDHVIKYNAAGGNLNLTNLLPAGYQTGDWEASHVVIPNDGAPGTTNEYLLKMYGPSDASAKGIVEGYSQSRSVPQSPDPATTGSSSNSWLARMTDVGDDNWGIIGNAQFENDNLPYDQDDYPGGAGNFASPEIHDQSFITATTIGGTTRLKGGNFPCGLMKLEILNTGDDPLAVTIQLDLVPGNHRGYLCEPMTEM